ncbi:hypothetical protein SPRG_12939 [Saprolegnia parasitica CBS 223.65]|uniref:Uncharacterized protein n=1 Tax=Saprolegnia parasitica (strain CBS 223.65) TaxID=695850 RepID=A0A067BSC3_SAPPC|nr:hypothetical protein SPRG_12939 [Saprolegnia parasitica CBS 223.65]KDO21158.1 hypothetical protein SPRG_12939 [Saprolegnia parasitica CBS 223.65]|eukprot:XP_012208157.1 hypothetical protein SPRG_12939 [Saprolegnia parasitica CBS 223.65]
MVPALVEPRSPVGSAVVEAYARSARAATECYGLTKDLPWPCARGSLASLIPSLAAMNLHLALVEAVAGHIAACFRYRDPLGDVAHGRSPFDLVLIVDATPEPKYDQAFQLELLQELAADASPDPFVAANTDMLLARHNAPVLHMAFLRASKTLRFVVARQDGHAYVWEWAREKLSWVYLNSFRFADDPVAALTAFPTFAGAHGLAWSDANGALQCRHVSFETIPSLAKHPTHIVVGHPMTLPRDASSRVALLSSSRGLWLVSDCHVELKSAQSPVTHSCSHPSPLLDLVACVHDVTGALLTLAKSSGILHLAHLVKGQLHCRRLPFTLPAPASVVALACHRQFLLVTTLESTLVVYDVHSGAEATSLSLPTATTYRLWGSVVYAGVYAEHAFYRLKLPSATQYAESLPLGFAHLRDHGPSLRFPQVAAAYASLRRAHVNDRKGDAYDTVAAHLEHPALLLALLTDAKVPESIVDDLRGRLGAMQLHYKHALHAVPAAAVAATPLRPLTPINLDSFAYVHAWLQLNCERNALLQPQTNVRPRARTAESDVSLDMQRFRPTPLTISRELHALSPLQFTSWACSAQFGRRLLRQLEALLLENVVFKSHSPTSGVPSHLLFHEERTASDYRRSPATKQLYFECMARLYAQHEPSALSPFVACVDQYCPRLFSLEGQHLVPTRRHSQRALLALSPLALSTTKEEKAAVSAHADVLCQSDAWLEAATLLLAHDEYAKCVLLLDRAPDAVCPLLYWPLLRHCVEKQGPDDLVALLQRKPASLSSSLVLRHLQSYVSSSVSLGALRPAIRLLLRHP